MSECEELQIFLDSAILGELGQLFNLQFTDSVFDHEEYYCSVPEVLKSRGYHLHKEPGHGVHLSKGEIDYHINFGAIDAVFVNDMVERSLGYEHLTGYPVKFSHGDNAGRLGNYSTVLTEHFRDLNVTPAQADPTVVKYFKSDEVVENQNHGTIYVAHGKEVDDISGFQSFSDEGHLKIDLPTGPGYWRVDIGKAISCKKKPPTLKVWEKCLDKAKFSYKYVPSIGHLFFSNTKGAKYGLPPTAHHMNWPPLALRDTEHDEVGTSGAAPPTEEWKQIIGNFRDEPNPFTFNAVLTRIETKSAFRYYNRRGYIGAGSRDIGKKLKAELTGHGKSVTFPEFAEFIETVSFPSGLEYYLCNLFKIGRGMSYDSEGKVYVH